MKKYYFILLVLSCLLIACEQKIDKQVTWPEWASRPILSDMSVTGSGVEITAGEKVTFKARIEDSFNDLSSYTLEIKYSGNQVVYRKTEALSGSLADISLDFELPFAAGLDDNSYPEVTLTAINVMNGSASRRVSKENNVRINRPKLPEVLWLVDQSGNRFEMHRNGDFYHIDPGADLSALGAQFRIAERLSGTQPDYTGLVWGMQDGRIVIIHENGDNAIATPDSGGYGFKALSLDTYQFTLSKLINYKYVLDMATLADDEQGGVKYKQVENVMLLRDCEVEFIGFGELKSFLQPDRFEILSATTAKFTGQTSSWGIYYDTNDNWLIINHKPWNMPDQLWITGTKACYPLGNEGSENAFSYLAGDGKQHTASLCGVKGEDGAFRCLIYLKTDYALQLYRWVKWSTVIQLNSLTPGIGKITDTYIVPGDDFKPGVYLLTLVFTDEGNDVGDHSVADVSLTSYSLN